MPGGIFISYRREDAAPYARLIYDRVVSRIDRSRVFIDVDNIEPGYDFVEVLTERVARCDILVAIVGRHWVETRDAADRRRLDNPRDFVRIEIETALQRGIRVIPVLVDGAAPPRPEDLPESLWPFCNRQAIEVSHTRFDADAAALTRCLEQAEELRAAPRERKRRTAPLALASLAAAAIAAGGVWWLGPLAHGGGPPPVAVAVGVSAAPSPSAAAPAAKTEATMPSPQPPKAAPPPTPAASQASPPAILAPAPSPTPVASQITLATTPVSAPPTQSVSPPAADGGEADATAAPSLSPMPAEAPAPTAQAALSAPAQPATSAPAPPPPVVESARELEQQLRRVGCYDGAERDESAPEVQRAVAAYARAAGLPAPPPQGPWTEWLKSLSAAKGRVCPLICPPGRLALNGRCVRRPVPVAARAEAPPPASRPAPVAHPSAPRPRPASNGDCFEFNGQRLCQ